MINDKLVAMVGDLLVMVENIRGLSNIIFQIKDHTFFGGLECAGMQRHGSERVERKFAHVCDSGGSRRTWLRGLRKSTSVTP